MSPRAHCSERLADGKVANGGGRPLKLRERPRRTPLQQTARGSAAGEASLRFQAHAREMVDAARRDDQAVDSGSLEHEAKGRLGHGLLPPTGRSP